MSCKSLDIILRWRRLRLKDVLMTASKTFFLKDEKCVSCFHFNRRERCILSHVYHYLPLFIHANVQYMRAMDWVWCYFTDLPSSQYTNLTRKILSASNCMPQATIFIYLDLIFSRILNGKFEWRFLVPTFRSFTIY